MSDRRPRPRGPIRETSHSSEIKDNWKNVVTASRRSERLILQNQNINNRNITNNKKLKNDPNYMFLCDSSDEEREVLVSKEQYDNFKSFTEVIPLKDIRDGKKYINTEKYIRTSIDGYNRGEVYVPYTDYLIYKSKRKNQNMESDSDEDCDDSDEPAVLKETSDTNDACHISQTLKTDKLFNAYSTSNKFPLKYKSLYKWILPALIMIISFGLFWPTIASFLNEIDIFLGETKNSQEKLNDLKISLQNMETEFKNQDKELWFQTFSSIRRIYKDPVKPSILILIHDKAEPLNCIGPMLNKVSSAALNSSNLILRPTDFPRDTGMVIEKLKFRIKNSKAVLIWDFLNINLEALKAFHSLCDRINPLIEGVFYIITIIDSSYKDIKNSEDYIEKKLFYMLNGHMKQDSIGPLITRFTDGPIVSIKSESNSNCPISKIL